MNDDPTENGQPSNDELEALRARVAELEAPSMNEKLQDPSGSVSGGDLPSIPMNSDKQPQTQQVPVWATLLILIVGTIAGALIVHWLDGPPTEKELLQQELERIKRQ